MQRVLLRTGQPPGMTDQRPAQLMQPGEGQLHLGLHTHRSGHPAPPGPADQVIQQRRLAHAWLTPDNQGLSFTCPHVNHEPVQDSTFTAPVDQSWHADLRACLVNGDSGGLG
jgi:hypothetical protein